MSEHYHHLPHRPRRNRRNASIRSLMRETVLTPGDLVAPFFVLEGENQREPIGAMPGQDRLSIDLLLKEVDALSTLGVNAIALFPAIDDSLKNDMATESTNADGLLQRTIKALKAANPNTVVIPDVAMDPYSDQGHDGYVKDGEIVNDITVDVLVDMSVAQAKAGADYVAPSDMMDGRVGAIRSALDANGYTDVGILSYSAKYASAFYGPFREALDSSPRFGDKKTYQMDYANRAEAIREVILDVEEGADIVMVKPALPYLDILRDVKDAVDVPVSAYQVSGEYAMIKATAANGWMDEDNLILESLTSIKRAGADMIFTYFAKRAAELLKN